MMLRKLALMMVLMVVLPTVLSCTGARPWSQDSPTKSPPDETVKLPRPSERAVALARIHMQAGDYQKAIDTYHAAYLEESQDQALLNAYRDSLAYMITTADASFDRQEIGAAGRTYDVLLKNYPHFKGFEESLAFTRSRLNERLEACKKILFKQGFQEYRNGNLDRAIGLWQDLLVIDPQNTGIQEALRTAKLQRKNLKAAD